MKGLLVTSAIIVETLSGNLKAFAEPANFAEPKREAKKGIHFCVGPGNHWDGPIDWSNLRKHQELYSWQDGIKENLRINSGDKFSKILSASPEYKQVACKFFLKTDGTIENLSLIQKSGSESLDQLTLHSIANLSPIKSPPNSMPYERGMYISIFKNATPTNVGFIVRPLELIETKQR